MPCGNLKSRYNSSIMSKNPYRSLLIILLAYLGLALAYGVILPPFENLDEPEHFEVIRYIVNTGQLPVHGAADTEAYHIRQEASQPPLYYLLAAGLVRLTGAPTGDIAAYTQLNPRVACGTEAPHLYDNRAVLRHNPHAEAFPWRGPLLTLHLLRLLSTLLQLFTVTGAFMLGRRLFPDRPAIPVLGAAIVAFNPQFLLVASGVNNDNLVTPLATLVLWLTARLWHERRLPLPHALLLGALCGAAGLSKLSGWLTLAPCAALFVTLWLRRDAPRFRLTLHALLIPLTALTLGSAWFWRNWQLYGDITALTPMLAVVGVRGWSTPLQGFQEAGLMFRSFWGQLPCTFYPAYFYIFYTLIAAGSGFGLLWGFGFKRNAIWKSRLPLLALLGWFLLITASWLRWNMMTPAPGGRLLFPALPAVALVMAAGLTQLGPPRRSAQIGVAALLLMALWTGAVILPGFFAPPRRTAAAHPTYLLEATFADTIHLHGYDIALDKAGQQLDLTLYWEAATGLDEDYILALQLVSPIPGDTTQRWTYDSWPGRGNYPTGAWLPGRVIVDRYRFDLPAAEFYTQAWDLHLALYREASGERLPISREGTPAGEHLIVTRLRVPGERPTCPSAAALPGELRLGDAVRLTHAAIASRADGATVTLCWEADRALHADYTIFVHLLDSDSVLKATGDGPPANGAFPTAFWLPGDRILDVHTLSIPLAPGDSVAVGLYHPIDGTRLPALRDGVSAPHDALIIFIHDNNFVPN